ncbi:hypothetical protein SIM91_43425 [Rhodococcus opacus]|uniref:hypothetical protein n=1 Tax=Rhodococcus opacus TaxID=37919 RepID=UPI0002A1DE65|nr:hypothetical protein [Rhodococcus opacus]ELB92174.1 hypothetical protein Rwratislav_15528 [Rhodococcus wratislaviensis IFP 2016]MDX5970015.1 hypothetical protein [Rhodococcus opacus]
MSHPNRDDTGNHGAAPVLLRRYRGLWAPPDGAFGRALEWGNRRVHTVPGIVATVPATACINDLAEAFNSLFTADSSGTWTRGSIENLEIAVAEYID